jgi:hypothetical protein
MSRISEKTLAQILQNIKNSINVNSIHFDHKLNSYKILGIALDEETEVPYMYYRRVGTDKIQISPWNPQLHFKDISFDTLKDVPHIPTVNSVWHHYSDSSKLYKVCRLAVDDVTGDIKVIYQALYGSGLIWIRKLSLWNSIVAGGGYRFKIVPYWRQIFALYPMELSLAIGAITIIGFLKFR